MDVMVDRDGPGAAWAVAHPRTAASWLKPRPSPRYSPATAMVRLAGIDQLPETQGKRDASRKARIG